MHEVQLSKFCISKWRDEKYWLGKKSSSKNLQLLSTLFCPLPVITRRNGKWLHKIRIKWPREESTTNFKVLTKKSGDVGYSPSESLIVKKEVFILFLSLTSNVRDAGEREQWSGKSPSRISFVGWNIGSDSLKASH